jgi:hypothetical protein
MPKRSSNDPNILAHRILAEATREKNPAAVALGRLGGLKGGKARALKISAEQRSDIARNAAQKRWGKKKKTGKSTLRKKI